MSRRVSIEVSLRIDGSPYRTILEKEAELGGSIEGFEELVREALEKTKDLIERK